MGFVQIIDFHSSNADEIRALADEWERATGETEDPQEGPVRGP